MSFLMTLMDALENRGKVEQAICLGRFYEQVSSMPLPTVFIHLHKNIPPLSKLTKEEQVHIIELEDILKKILCFIRGEKKYGFGSNNDVNLCKKFQELLESEKQVEIIRLVETIEGYLNDFYIKLSELEKFKEIYE